VFPRFVERFPQSKTQVEWTNAAKLEAIAVHAAFTNPTVTRMDQMLGDIKNSSLIHFKGWLFFITGLLSAGILIAETMDLKIACLLLLSVWSFCRFYYYAFYVIEKYTDSQFKYAGLISFIRYLWFNKRS
jgi:hypothetical protein